MSGLVVGPRSGRAIGGLWLGMQLPGQKYVSGIVDVYTILGPY